MTQQISASRSPSARLHRRECLRVGLAGIAGLSLPDLWRLRSCARGAEAAPVRKNQKALIVVWLPGGASHLETYDPKPHAGSDYAGPFPAISTAVTGMHVSELLPRHAQVADRFTILRSLVHTGFCHQQGTHQLLTGHPVRELKQKPDHPDCLSIASYYRQDTTRDLPAYIGVPPINYSGSAYLGPAYEPFAVHGDVNAPAFEVPNIGLKHQQTADLRRRIDLRKQFDQLQRDVDQLGGMQAFDTFEQQAWNLLTSPSTRKAFELAQETDATRDRYGRNSWGQQCLLARRLVEAGVDIVTTQFAGPLCGRVGNWDDHAVNHHVFKGMEYRAPAFDRAIAALIEDIYERGLDDRVMLVVTGEFGRTPRISYSPSSGEGVASAATGTVQPGRDHWPSATSLLFAGGGLETGRVIGATDARGEQVVERLVTVQDFLATIYSHLDIPAASAAITDFSGRPIPILSDGKPIPELLAT